MLLSGFQKAVRENIWVKTLLIGSSGSGKTFSALRMATGFAKELSGITGKEERIALIDTESRRSTYYAKEFDFDILDLKAPFTPERYVEAINMAVDAGYKVLVIDSITHEWSGKGGCLEMHSKIPGNSYTAWGKITPRHEKFTDILIDSPIHIFSTVRGDDKYVLEEVNGKQIPRKVPIGYDQRKNTEYLFTVSFMLEQDSHIATAVKDNTHIFEDRNDILTESHGIELCKWANDGDVDSKRAEIEKEKDEAKAKIKLEEDKEAKEMADKLDKKRQKQKEIQPLTLPDVISQIDTIAKSKAKTNRKGVADAITKHHDNANYNSITNVEVAKNVLSELESL
jgi:hypothetical protein